MVCYVNKVKALYGDTIYKSQVSGLHLLYVYANDIKWAYTVIWSLLWESKA